MGTPGKSRALLLHALSMSNVADMQLDVISERHRAEKIYFILMNLFNDTKLKALVRLTLE